MELKGKRVTIRPVTETDIPVIHRWWNDPVVMREVRAEKLKPSLEMVRKHWAAWQNPGPRDFHMFIICLGGKPIGEIGYRCTDSDTQTFSLDIKIGETDLWGRGLAAAANRLFIDWLFNGLHARRLTVEPGDWNQRSIRLAQKCGFKEIRREASPANAFFDGGVGVTMQLDRD
ncbi:MAG: GNAT family N-acetyltransferase [Dehalococcoidales bacterium]|jgi:aminoglycoside 6'-N-acetyltransferase